MIADFGKTADDYRKHRAGFPDSFFEELQTRGLIRGFETVADVGTGTGAVARGLAEIGCEVVGVDPSAKMLSTAEAMAEEQGVVIDWRQGSAEATGLADDSVDVVTAGQCWHWFDHQRAIEEAKRILKPGGTLLIAHFDWLPVRGSVVWHTEQLILEANPDWHLGGQIGIYPEWFRHLFDGEFADVSSFTYFEPAEYTHEAWRGRIRASAGVGGSLPEAEVETFDENHKAMLEELFPSDPLSIPHQVFVIYGRI